MALLQIENLSFSYPEAEQPVLDHVSFSVEKGEFVVVCGRSGCGKSTLLRLIKRELSPYGRQTGRIHYQGTALPCLEDAAAAAEIGLILQNPESQIVTDSVWHELAFGLENLGLDPERIRRRVAETAGYFGIESWFHKKTAQLSGGQKQLLNLASVLAMNPVLLLLDEPTAQLDPIAAEAFITELYRLNRELGLTVILVEHRLESVFPIADRVLLLEEGRAAFFDRPRAAAAYFQAHPEHPMHAALPAAMRIFSLLDGEGEGPMTVREGRSFVTGQYGNRVSAIEEPPASCGGETVLELREVFFRYERNLPDVLRGASLRVFQGEHVCILGGNGTGKTTALGVAAGLLKAYRGKVLMYGKPIDAWKQNQLYVRGIALLPQNPQTLFLEKTVEEDLLETCMVMGDSNEQAKARIAEKAELLEIRALLKAHPYDLSGGEQQKAALAKILLLEPRILLLDEPTKGIDACSKQTLVGLLTRWKEDGMTILTVTHDVDFAASSADRVAMFFDGALLSPETPCRFFSENRFYTTAASRIARGHYANAVLCEQVAALCRTNGRVGDCL